MQVSAGEVPADARRALGSIVRRDQAVAYFKNPASGEVMALVQDEKNRENVSAYSWSGKSWRLAPM